MRKSYHVAVDAWINGRFHAAGATIIMTAVEAKYLLLAGTLAEPEPPKPAAKPRREPAE